MKKAVRKPVGVSGRPFSGQQTALRRLIPHSASNTATASNVKAPNKDLAAVNADADTACTAEISG